MRVDINGIKYISINDIFIIVIKNNFFAPVLRAKLLREKLYKYKCLSLTINNFYRPNYYPID